MPMVAASGKEPVVWHRLRTTLFNDGTLGPLAVTARETRSHVLPEISRFLGIVIAMFYNDHNPRTFMRGMPTTGPSSLLRRVRLSKAACLPAPWAWSRNGGNGTRANLAKTGTSPEKERR
jgi:predicted nuclease of restriction endonuclease-like RecB superfamily